MRELFAFGDSGWGDEILADLAVTLQLGIAALALALGMVFGAFSAEVLRGAFNALDAGQSEAGRAVGMSTRQVFLRVNLPQAWRCALPGLGNLWINLLKDTALVSIIALDDLMGRTRQVFSRTFDYSSYLWAALIYLGITIIFVFVWRQLELHMTRHMLTLSSCMKAEFWKKARPGKCLSIRKPNRSGGLLPTLADAGVRLYPAQLFWRATQATCLAMAGSSRKAVSVLSRLPSSISLYSLCRPR